ncbi:hypothetical protein I7X09_18400 [Rhodococcus sp. P-2]|nr:hypothetical protein [Rhodococcus sp. P-2]QQM20045.1 hypothetical protein I7X09_18400 [Rhodococcus sp. P-2]
MYDEPIHAANLRLERDPDFHVEADEIYREPAYDFPPRGHHTTLNTPR